MELPALPPAGSPRGDLVASYRGPTKTSNWVVPGMVMGGDRSSLDSKDGVKALLAAGVTTIVCLQSRQETNAAVDYRKRVRSFRPDAQFVEQPIPDQQVADDGIIGDLLDQLVERLERGEVLYVHCRGGHGRTNTICALLLGHLYKMDAPEAMARAQLYHDTRQKPVFAADGYQETPDGKSCVVFFPPQRLQVLRMLGGAAAVEAASPPAALARASSNDYGSGASSYREDDMARWHDVAKKAATALNKGKHTKAAGSCADYRGHLQLSVDLFSEAAKLRPDFARGYVGLSKAYLLQGQCEEANRAVEEGLLQCPGDSELLQQLERVVQEAAAPESTPTSAQGEADNTAAGATLAAAPAPLAFSWRPSVLSPRLVILVGLPGSGKSTFSDQLVRSGRGWERCCQDELGGSRSAFEDAIGRAARDDSKRLILDRTNVRRDDRRAFLSLAFNPKGAVCVHFDMPATECEDRVAKRTDHPTIPYGRGRNAVRSMKDSFEMPGRDEGFDEVITIRDFHEANYLLKCWGADAPQVNPSGFFKFPTTPHVLDLTHGKALTESDRLLSPDEAIYFFNGSAFLTIEEKIDGANLGISLTENYEPQFQNRAHYVTSTYATQWKALDAWWDEHGWAVCQLLEPEVEVLFGEWMWARHSVSYTQLPGYFIAFDIYNKRTGRFASVRERDRRLGGLGIPVTPQVAEGVFRDRSELEALLTRQSAFGDGALEGIYLRIDEPEEKAGGLCLEKRGKIVRADFVQGIEDGGHWINKQVQRNKLA